MKLKIAGGRVIDPAQKLDKVVDLYIDDGAVVALGEQPENFVAEEV
ncbi:MAG: dihydroorotase, partial [Oceanospirillaceae bacterium]|nr:dihydroorotase [Oceanospirillaceae bacterium]